MNCCCSDYFRRKPTVGFQHKCAHTDKMGQICRFHLLLHNKIWVRRRPKFYSTLISYNVICPRAIFHIDVIINTVPNSCHRPPPPRKPLLNMRPLQFRSPNVLEAEFAEVYHAPALATHACAHARRGPCQIVKSARCSPTAQAAPMDATILVAPLSHGRIHISAAGTQRELNPPRSSTPPTGRRRQCHQGSRQHNKAMHGVAP